MPFWNLAAFDGDFVGMFWYICSINFQTAFWLPAKMSFDVLPTLHNFERRSLGITLLSTMVPVVPHYQNSGAWCSTLSELHKLNLFFLKCVNMSEYFSPLIMSAHEWIFEYLIYATGCLPMSMSKPEPAYWHQGQGPNCQGQGQNCFQSQGQNCQGQRKIE